MMKPYYILFSIFFQSLLFTPMGLAQQTPLDLKFRRLSENSQLSNLTIRSIHQDSKGFLWVGTLDGLNRFDGYDFKVYKNIENDSNSLFKNQIQTIFEDSRGTLWVSTLNSGLHRYNRSADVFHRIAEFSKQNCRVLRITEDSDHFVWIGGLLDSHAFVARLDHQSGNWDTFLLFPAKEGITSMVQHSMDEFWFRL